MNRHALHGIVHDAIERPPTEIVERFKAFSVATIARACRGNGLMHHEIKPLNPGIRICGPAVTLFGRQGDANMYQGVPDSLRPGDIVIGDAAGAKSLAVCGERVAYNICRLFKAGGMVIDGAIRDKAGMEEEGVPIFYRGVDPKLFGASGPGAINVPVQCGGVIVYPGDLIIGDRDGVIVIKRGEILKVLEKVDCGSERSGD
ncbi:MAG: hypothetical protein Q4C04_01655 [Clostridia bacterium]|nr:hypothetical protein [Clostridia bacterium]